jgi:CheY-like chemotaxis protein
MNILFVEDDENKRDDIVAWLRHNYQGANVASAASYQSALKTLMQARFDAILLDMTIPTFDKGSFGAAGRLRPLGGRDLLDQMSRRRIPGRVIVITGYDLLGDGDSALPLKAVVDDISNQFGHLFVGAVFYSRAEERWKIELKQLVDAVLGK